MALTFRPLTLASILCRKSPLTAMTCPVTNTRFFHLNRRLDKAPAAAGGAKKGKAAAGGKVKLEVETDPYKLQKYCCGSNYFLEGEDVELKPDSEYPDWLWKMDIKRPKPKAHEMEPGTIEYYKQVQKEDQEHWYKLKKLKIQPKYTKDRK